MSINLTPTQRSVYGMVAEKMLYAATGTIQPPVVTDSDIKNKVLKPRADVPVVDLKTGLMTPDWYRYINFVDTVKLGGALGPTLVEIKDNVIAVNEQTTTTIAAIAQTVEINAASQAASLEVAQTNNTPGAAEIPPPVIIVPARPITRPQPIEAVP